MNEAEPVEPAVKLTGPRVGNASSCSVLGAGLGGTAEQNQKHGRQQPRCWSRLPIDHRPAQDRGAQMGDDSLDGEHIRVISVAVFTEPSG